VRKRSPAEHNLRTARAISTVSLREQLDLYELLSQLSSESIITNDQDARSRKLDRRFPVTDPVQGDRQREGIGLRDRSGLGSTSSQTGSSNKMIKNCRSAEATKSSGQVSRV